MEASIRTKSSTIYSSMAFSRLNWILNAPNFTGKAVDFQLSQAAIWIIFYSRYALYNRAYFCNPNCSFSNSKYFD